MICQQCQAFANEQNFSCFEKDLSLYAAAKTGHLVCFEAAIKQTGFDMNALQIAGHYKHLNILRYIVENYDDELGYIDPLDFTFIACQKGHSNYVLNWAECIGLFEAENALLCFARHDNVEGIKWYMENYHNRYYTNLDHAMSVAIKYDCKDVITYLKDTYQVEEQVSETEFAVDDVVITWKPISE